jgi:hypothetical protein
MMLCPEQTTLHHILVMSLYAPLIFTQTFTIALEIGKKLRFLFYYFRENCFKSTLVHLTERFKGKEVFLVGTCNQSTMLAQRTKKLIEELKPDTVIVQTNEKWW